MTACWFSTCSCSGLTPTIINEDYYYYYYRWLRLFRVHQSTHGNTPHAKTHFPTFPVSPEHFKTQQLFWVFQATGHPGHTDTAPIL